MSPPYLRHLRDHVTDRGRVADEVVILQTDVAMQSHQVEPLVVENRRDRDVRFIAVKPESARDTIAGVTHGQDRHVDVGHTDHDILRTLQHNGSQQIDLPDRADDYPADSQPDRSAEVRVAQRIGVQRQPLTA